VRRAIWVAIVQAHDRRSAWPSPSRPAATSPPAPTNEQPAATRTADRHRRHPRERGRRASDGKPIHIAEHSWKGALGRVLTAGVAVLRTIDRADSAAWLNQLHRLEAKGPSETRGRPRTRRPTEDLRQVAEDVLGCLPGISTIGARRLLDHFGSLAAVFAAEEAQLRAVTGIGPVRAAALARLFRGHG
jgi:ERCC4-type nuclease